MDPFLTFNYQTTYKEDHLIIKKSEKNKDNYLNFFIAIPDNSNPPTHTNARKGWMNLTRELRSVHNQDLVTMLIDPSQPMSNVGIDPWEAEVSTAETPGDDPSHDPIAV